MTRALIPDAQIAAGFFFSADIDLRGGVLTNAHESQAGLGAALFQRDNPPSQFIKQLAGNGAPIDEIRGHSIT